MKGTLISLKKQYLLFVFSLILVVAGSQFLIHYDINKQNSDAHIINLAGRQRMLSQRISKLAQYIVNEHQKNGYAKPGQVDTLQVISRQWQRLQFGLQHGDAELKIGPTTSPAILKLFEEASPLLKKISHACSRIVANPGNLEIITDAAQQIEASELSYLLIMERIAHAYQREAETKLTELKQLEWLLTMTAGALLFFEFLFIIFPSLKKMERSNRFLQRTNAALLAKEKALQTTLLDVNKLKANLEEREKQYRDLVEDSIDLIYELDDRGFFIFANEVMVKVSGYSREELYQRSYLDLVAPTFRAEATNFYRLQKERMREDTYLEFKMLTRAGREIWMGQNVRFQFEQSGWVSKVKAIARDISPIKESNRKFLDEHILLRTIIDNIPINIYAKNRNSQKILANKAEWEFVGASREEEVLGRDDYQLFPEESAQQSREEDLIVLKGHSILNKETLNVRKDGSKTWFLTSKVPLHNELEEIVGLVGIGIDITEQKKAQEALRKQEALYRLVSENSHDVISLHSLDGTFEFVSPSCIELHGYTENELIGKVGTEFIYPDDAAKIIEMAPVLRKKWENGEQVEPIQFRLMSRHRGLVWVENVMKPIWTNGILTGFQSTLRDISTRKEYEIALREAKEKAESATRAKSQFLSMMSHEIRTPMNAILGITDLLLDERLSASQNEKLKLLKFSGQNLLSIINDVLDFSKIEADKIEIEHVSFHLGDLVHRTVDVLRARVTETAVTLTCEIDDALPPYVKGDPLRLNQILTNLIGNALKFTHMGKVEVRVRSVSPEFIRFEISDTGIGIPADKLDTIFESFTQAASDTARHFGGTGLGLAITKRLLTRMGSQIKVTSELGKGSVFQFDLPFDPGTALEKPEEAMTVISELSGRVLLVEDNRINQVVANNFLTRWGLDVTIAQEGTEAIEIIRQRNIDLILMDLQMPGLDGYEATQQIRQLPDSYFQQIPIVALTADAMSSTKEKVMNAGMNDLVGKPFEPLALYQVLAKYVTPLRQRVVKLKEALDVYTDKDISYQRELTSLLFTNLQELQVAVRESVTQKDVVTFRKILHKMKTTLTILSDKQLDDSLRNLGQSLSETNPQMEVTSALLRDFDWLCNRSLMLLPNIEPTG